MKQRVKAYAKINLSLNVYQSENGYHALDSVVTTIDLYDTITVSKRKDDKMNVVMRGIGEEFLYGENNNAYKAAKLFQQTFATKGADITVIKNIPISRTASASPPYCIFLYISQWVFIPSETDRFSSLTSTDSTYISLRHCETPLRVMALFSIHSTARLAESLWECTRIIWRVLCPIS